MHIQNFLTAIAISIIASGVMAFFMRIIKQPLMIGYIIAGIILGPGIGFSVIGEMESIELISEIGLIFLLFIIGLEINLKEMISSGKNILILALSQVMIGCILTYIMLNFLVGNSFTFLEMVYLSFCFNLTSTLIVVKILNDKFETQTIAAKLTVGISIFQDFFAIIFLAFQKDFLSPQYSLFIKSFVYTLLLLFLSFNFSRYFLSKVIHANSKNVEFVIITSIAYCFVVSVAANYLGLSKEMGALIAGLSIANSPYSEEIVIRISSVRDFFVTLFFVSLGLKMPAIKGGYILLVLGIMIIILVARFLSIIFYHRILKIGMRPLFVTALNLFPVSEFALVISALGVGYKHISNDVSVIILITMILSSVAATYIINYNHEIYSFFAKKFNLQNFDESLSSYNDINDILILGYNRITYELVRMIKEKNPSLSIEVADFNAANSKILTQLDAKWTYVDLSNYESIKRLEKLNPKIIISPMSNLILKGTDTYQLLMNIRSIFPKSKVIFIAETEEENQKLSNLGAKVINISKLSSQKIVRDVLYYIGRGFKKTGEVSSKNP
ncbi:MAG: cation:proton antiporter [Elusimicrobiota bacterium]